MGGRPFTKKRIRNGERESIFFKHPPCHLCYNKLVIGKRKPHAPKRLVRLSPIRAPRRTENIHLSCHLNTNYKKQEAR